MTIILSSQSHKIVNNKYTPRSTSRNTSIHHSRTPPKSSPSSRKNSLPKQKPLSESLYSVHEACPPPTTPHNINDLEINPAHQSKNESHPPGSSNPHNSHRRSARPSLESRPPKPRPRVADAHGFGRDDVSKLWDPQACVED